MNLERCNNNWIINDIEGLHLDSCILMFVFLHYLVIKRFRTQYRFEKQSFRAAFSGKSIDIQLELFFGK